jgi:hypothetical protein
MNLSQLKSELQEKEKGCGKRFNYYGDGNFVNTICTMHGINCNGVYCPTCQAEISALKKGISACEEILNSQQNKNYDVCDSTSSQALSKQRIVDTGSADTQEKLTSEGIYSTEVSPVQTLINQALSQRNKEILEIIDKFNFFESRAFDKEVYTASGDIKDWERFFNELKSELKERLINLKEIENDTLTTTSEGKE